MKTELSEDSHSTSLVLQTNIYVQVCKILTDHKKNWKNITTDRSYLFICCYNFSLDCDVKFNQSWKKDQWSWSKILFIMYVYLWHCKTSINPSSSLFTIQYYRVLVLHYCIRKFTSCIWVWKVFHKIISIQWTVRDTIWIDSFCSIKLKLHC